MIGLGASLGILVGVGLGTIACGTALFACAGDGDCQDGGQGGVCQAEGVCSFPADDCPSGQKFGSHSGALSNECVPVDDGSTGGVGTSSSTASADDDPTLDVSGVDTLPDTSSTLGPLDATGDASTTNDEGTTGSEVDPTLLLWFTFEHDTADALVNDGVLGGTAPCSPDSCPMPLAEGAIGSAAAFDGDNDCGIYPFVDDLNAPAFTLALWLRRDVHVPGYDGAFTKPVGAGAFNTWRVYTEVAEDGPEVFGVHVGLQDDMGVEISDVLELGVWTHMAATWTGTELEMFVNGQSIGVMPSLLFEVDEHDVYVGCDDDVPIGITHFLHGSLDDVRMYSRVLDPAEIAELVEGEVP